MIDEELTSYKVEVFFNFMKYAGTQVKTLTYWGLTSGGEIYRTMETPMLMRPQSL